MAICSITMMHRSLISNTHSLNISIAYIPFQLTTEEFCEIHRHDAWVNDYANQFDFYRRMNQRTSLDTSKRIHPNCQTLEQWVCSERSDIIKKLDTTSSPGSAELALV